MADSSDSQYLPGPWYAGVLYDAKTKKIEIFSTNSIDRYVDDANSDINTMTEDENHVFHGLDFAVVYSEEVSKDDKEAADKRREEIKKLSPDELAALIRTQTLDF